jgi:hypothetical protein
MILTVLVALLCILLSIIGLDYKQAARFNKAIHIEPHIYSMGAITIITRRITKTL